MKTKYYIFIILFLIAVFVPLKSSVTEAVVKFCTPNWKCMAWSLCVNGQQTRTCSDFNYCGVLTGQPEHLQKCCSSNWKCEDWSSCNDGQQVRLCSDINNCTVPTNNPSIARNCTVPVKPSITITSPNGGEAWISGSKYDITWTSTGLPNNSKTTIWLQDDKGNKTTAAYNIPVGSGSYSWTVPAKMSGYKYSMFIKVLLPDGSYVSNNVSNDFMIFLNIPITITLPNGGETWLLGSIHNITWTLAGAGLSGSPTVSLWLQDDQGSKTVIAANLPASSGSYPWTIPYATPTPSGFHYSILATLSDGDYTYAASSNNYFSIFDHLSIMVVSPNNTTCTVGQACNITWVSSGIDKVNIKLKTISSTGATYLTIASDVPASQNSFSWALLPSLYQDAAAGSTYVITVTSADGSISGMGEFTIAIPTASLNFTQDNLASISSALIRIIRAFWGK